MNWKKTAIVAIIGVTSVSALAFPWDIDLVDTPLLRGYEWKMATPADGSVSINHHREYDYSSLDSDFVTKDMEATGGKLALEKLLAAEQEMLSASNPYSDLADPKMLAQGERMFQVYCRACHGEKGTGKTTQGNAWPVSDPTKNRFTGIPNIHQLNDSTGMILGGNGYYFSPEKLYLYIRNGAGRMPAYGHAMFDDEIWSVVHYVRSLKDQPFQETP